MVRRDGFKLIERYCRSSSDTTLCVIVHATLQYQCHCQQTYLNSPNYETQRFIVVAVNLGSQQFHVKHGNDYYSALKEALDDPWKTKTREINIPAFYLHFVGEVGVYYARIGMRQ